MEYKVGDKIRIIADRDKIKGCMFKDYAGTTGSIMSITITGAWIKMDKDDSRIWFETGEFYKEPNMDKKLIAEKINQLPVCEDGKRAVTELVKALGFEVETSVARQFIYKMINNKFGISMDKYTSKEKAQAQFSKFSFLAWINPETGELEHE